ncbi:MAG: 3-isopropylmalate dehydratase small subunit [Pseudomonadales bacterium]
MTGFETPRFAAPRFAALCCRPLPLLAANVDTDIITPMKRLTGRNARPLADYAFEAWRYDTGDADTGQPIASFPLNQPGYAGASIALTGENFGCGSSRQSAPQVLHDLGLRCLIGTSFGDIFFNNCFQLGMLPVVVAPEELAGLVEWEGEVTVDLAAQTIDWASGSIRFDVNPLKKRCLLEGLDDIALTLSREADIAAFQRADRQRRPWVYEL